MCDYDGTICLRHDAYLRHHRLQNDVCDDDEAIVYVMRLVYVIIAYKITRVMTTELLFTSSCTK